MRVVVRALYRSRQLFGALRPRVGGDARDEAYALLSERERAVFESMTPRDRQHCLDVYRRLRAHGHDDTELLVAALLHDAGKGRIALWHRVAFVLLEASVPRLLRRLASPGNGSSWRQALYRCLRHPELGAEAAREAGSTQRVVTLIRSADYDELDDGALALKAADDGV